MSTPIMLPIHLRMARAALQWTVRDLEKRTGVNRNSISRYEAGHDILASGLHSLQKAIMNEGIAFFDEDKNYGTGVGLRKPARSKRASETR
jgi:transcriptional regulator with XRE-family HTH domain